MKVNDVSEKIKSTKEVLGFLGGSITTITLVLSKSKLIPILDKKSVLIGIDILNILVLLIAVTVLKPEPLSIKGVEIKNVKKHLAIFSDSEFSDILSRVNELVRQLVHCVRWFAIILGTFYLLQLFIDSVFPISFDKIEPVLHKTGSLLQLLNRTTGHEIPGVHNNIIPEGSAPDTESLRMDASKYLTLEIFTNSTNLFSAAYIFLAFQVLFSVTLDEDNKTWRFKSYIPFSVALIITLMNVILVTIGYSAIKLVYISHMMRLLGGIYNGVAMLLLFSRFLSMEYFFKNSDSSIQRTFYLYGTVLILPLYVVAQPLYGLFDAVEIGESAEIFKSSVFLVCLWGKLIFFLFIFTMLSNKWIHSYLFMVLCQKDTLQNITKEVKEIIDLNTVSESEMKKASIITG